MSGTRGLAQDWSRQGRKRLESLAGDDRDLRAKIESALDLLEEAAEKKQPFCRLDEPSKKRLREGLDAVRDALANNDRVSQHDEDLQGVNTFVKGLFKDAGWDDHVSCGTAGPFLE